MALSEQWHKSTRSNNTGGACVEARQVAGTVEVRDSKDQAGPRLAFTPEAWQAFAKVVKTL